MSSVHFLSFLSFFWWGAAEGKRILSRLCSVRAWFKAEIMTWAKPRVEAWATQAPLPVFIFLKWKSAHQSIFPLNYCPISALPSKVKVLVFWTLCSFPLSISLLFCWEISQASFLSTAFNWLYNEIRCQFEIMVYSFNRGNCDYNIYSTIWWAQRLIFPVCDKICMLNFSPHSK